MHYQKLSSIKKICIVAGEVSGDQLGAGLMRTLKELAPHLEFEGIGGDLMRAEGCKTWYDIADLSYFGVVDVVKNLPKILATIKDTKAKVRESGCELFIGIDNPDFNLRVESFCKNDLGIPTIHYVSPSVWAWRQGRIKTIRKAVSLMLCLLPFEQKFYQEQNFPARYVGHRLANQLQYLLKEDANFYLPWDEKALTAACASHYQLKVVSWSAIENKVSDNEEIAIDDTFSDNLHLNTFINYRGVDFNHLDLTIEPYFWENLPSYQRASQALGQQYPRFATALETHGTTIACLPGSRSSEIALILPQFLNALELLQESVGQLRILIPVAKPKLYPLIKQIAKGYPHLNITLVTSQAHLVLQSSACALVASGTATLDTMLCHIPMVVGYKLGNLNYLLARNLIKTKYIALSNIILDCEKALEMIQDDLNPVLLCKELERLLQAEVNLAHRLTYFQAHQHLDQNSDQLAAKAIEEFLAKRSQD